MHHDMTNEIIHIRLSEWIPQDTWDSILQVGCNSQCSLEPGTGCQNRDQCDTQDNSQA